MKTPLLNQYQRSQLREAPDTFESQRLKLSIETKRMVREIIKDVMVFDRITKQITVLQVNPQFQCYCRKEE